VAERRLVSVLFADLVGFTTLSEQRDAEEVRELLTQYFELARQDIVRYGGTVEKFIGDAVMAVWGTPVAHEDDAERAVRAALELVDAVAVLGSRIGTPELRLRAGVLTGEAAVTIGAEGQGMVAGDLVNSASRLQSAAEPGTVLVGRSTFLAANRSIAFEDAGAHRVKGKELPVEAYRALRVVAGHHGFRRTEQVEPPFVGRDGELRLLKDLFNATTSERRARLVSVTGIAGLGKSRLAWEFFKYIDGVVDDVYWHQGRCPAYGEGVTFWALGEMVRRRAHIAETEDAETSRHKLCAAVEEHVPDIDDRGWIEPRLAHLLGLAEVDVTEREELFAAWRSFFEHISESGPTVLVFEDLQWADHGLIDFIEYMLQWAGRHPIYMITLSRPELTDRRPTWGAGQKNFISLALEPLPPDAVSRLLTGLAPGIPDGLLARIIERAEGVPLYAVETIRMLVDQGSLVLESGGYRLVGELQELAVPTTLHALISARLDALPADERALLQDASVLGKTFVLVALAAVSGLRPDQLEAGLDALVRKELLDLDSDPRSPERGQYGFVGGLIREIAYGTMSRVDRKTRHLAAAHFFEAWDDDELAGVVATHYIEAHNAAPEGPEADALAARACDSLVTAGERAGSLGSPHQSLSYFEQAVGVTPSAETRIRLLERAADAALSAGTHETAERYLGEAVEWYERHENRAAGALAVAKLGRVLISSSRIEPATALLEKALADLEEWEDDPAVVELTAELARAYMLGGDRERALVQADRALRGAEGHDLTAIVAGLLITKGLAIGLLGRWREAIVLLDGVRRMSQQEGLSTQEVRAQVNLATALIVIDPVRGLREGKAALAGTRKLGTYPWEVLAAGNACWCALSTGDWDWALTVLGEFERDDFSLPYDTYLIQSAAMFEGLRGDATARDRLRGLEARIVDESTSPQDLAELRMAELWLALADGTVEQAYDLALVAADSEPGGWTEIQGLVHACRAALWLRDAQRAGLAFDRLTGRRMHGPWVQCARSTLTAGMLALQGRPKESATAYADAAARWRDLGVAFDLALCQLDFVMLVTDHPEAVSAAREAKEILTPLGAKPFVERLEAALADRVVSVAER
jgi:class 3 adenylate cyclase/tetratricopeptide (TPR) repeat protein